jgi:hypothetical protein
LRGVDRWKDVDFLIVAGAPQVNEGDLERTAEALWYLSPEPIRRMEPDANGKRAYTKEPRRIEMTDGSSTIVSIDQHPDKKCARLLDLIRREVGQALARARLIHRQPDRPCEIILLTNTPTDLPIHQTTTWEEATNVNLLDLMAARGMIPEAWRDVATLLADVIEADGSRAGDAAMMAFQRAGLPSPAELIEARVSNKPLHRGYYRGLLETQAFRYRVKGRRQGARILIDLKKHPDPEAAVERMFGELDVFEAVASGLVGEVAMGMAAAAPLAAPVEPAHPLPLPVAPQPPPETPALEAMPVEAVAKKDELSDLVALAPSQPEPPLIPAPESVEYFALVLSEPASEAEPEPSAFIGFGHEDPDYDEWCGWLGPDSAEMRRQASLPRLVVANMPAAPEELPDAELIRLLPPKRPTDTAVAWECRAHDVLRANHVEWFRAQKLVKRESAVHNWRAHCPVRLAPARDSP